jgi:hypothetical protein
VPLCPPQIPHGLTRDRTQASVVKGRRLTAWDMARQGPEVTLCITKFNVTKNATFCTIECMCVFRMDLMAKRVDIPIHN